MVPFAANRAIVRAMAFSFAQFYGLARSAVIYHGQPLKHRRARALYAQFVPPGGLCFDIGAHIGGRVAMFRRLRAHVIAVEPQPLFLNALRRMYAHRSGVTIVPDAIGAAPGETTMLVSDRHPTVSTLANDWAEHIGTQESFRGVEWNREVPVNVTTLDALIATYGLPDFCKIDVEGYERQVLAGLSQPLPALSFEVMPATCDEATACLDRLATLGTYEYNVSLGETARLIFDEWRDQTGIAAWLETLTDTSPSGDIYARLSVPAEP